MDNTTMDSASSTNAAMNNVAHLIKVNYIAKMVVELYAHRDVRGYVICVMLKRCSICDAKMAMVDRLTVTSLQPVKVKCAFTVCSSCWGDIRYVARQYRDQQYPSFTHRSAHINADTPSIIKHRRAICWCCYHITCLLINSESYDVCSTCCARLNLYKRTLVYHVLLVLGADVGTYCMQKYLELYYDQFTTDDSEDR